MPKFTSINDSLATENITPFQDIASPGLTEHSDGLSDLLGDGLTEWSSGPSGRYVPVIPIFDGDRNEYDDLTIGSDVITEILKEFRRAGQKSTSSSKSYLVQFEDYHTEVVSMQEHHMPPLASLDRSLP